MNSTPRPRESPINATRSCSVIRSSSPVVSVFSKKCLDNALGLLIFAFAEEVVTNSTLPVDEVICRPVFGVECFPDRMVAVDRNRGAGGVVPCWPEDIHRSGRRFKQPFGGGFRQAGIIAAEALYALEHHRSRLGEIHTRAMRRFSLRLAAYIRSLLDQL
jgi:hypothetical protein